MNKKDQKRKNQNLKLSNLVVRDTHLQGGKLQRVVLFQSPYHDWVELFERL